MTINHINSNLTAKDNNFTFNITDNVNVKGEGLINNADNIDILNNLSSRVNLGNAANLSSGVNLANLGNKVENLEPSYLTALKTQITSDKIKQTNYEVIINDNL